MHLFFLAHSFTGQVCEKTNENWLGDKTQIKISGFAEFLRSPASDKCPAIARCLLPPCKYEAPDPSGPAPPTATCAKPAPPLTLRFRHSPPPPHYDHPLRQRKGRWAPLPQQESGSGRQQQNLVTSAEVFLKSPEKLFPFPLNNRNNFLPALGRSVKPPQLLIRC